MRSSRGQATIEYVGAILLVAVIVSSAAVVVAAPGVPRTVVAKLRLGLCIVSGDVCTPAAAAARGLEPCELRSEQHSVGNGVTLWVFHGGGTDVWSARRMSDGTVVLTDSYGQSAGVTAGVQVGKKQLGDAAAGLGFGSGRAWTLSPARYEQLLGVTKGDPHRFRLLLPGLLGEPDEVFKEGSGDLDATLKTVGEATGRAVLGRRKGPDGTTYFVDLGTSGAALDLPGRIIGEYRAGDPPVLTLRGTTPRRGDEETETVLRLPLRDADDRALAQRIAFTDLGDPSLAMRDLGSRVHARGTIERSRYRVEEVSDGWDHGIKLGLSFGVDHASSSLERTLLDAEVLDGGPVPARREDCLGATA